jgi:transmembrane sensor
MNETNKDRTWELAASKVHGETTEAENNELDQLMQQPENREIYNQAAHLHQQLPKTHRLEKTSMTQSWHHITRHFRKKQIHLFLNITKYAAIVILALGAGVLIRSHFEPLREEPVFYSEILAPPGQMSEITLFDGTRVWLNSGTSVKVSQQFGLKDRKIELMGEAFFKVEHAKIPFTVQMKNHEVEVMGTSFAAVSYPDENFSQVTLVEGKVQINNAEGRAIRHLEPNQQIHIPDNAKDKITVREVSTLFYESWINGQIKFDEERLADVARRLERWYNIEIDFKCKEASELRFTGTVLKNKPIDQSMKAISLLLPIQVKYESNLASKDVITISKK